MERKHANIKGKNILIVDDEPIVQKLYSDILTSEGYNVECVENGEDALAFLKDTACFDVIIIDLLMPEMDGKTLYKHIEHDFPGLVEKIIFATGDLSHESDEFLKKTGRKFILKPSVIGEIKRVVKEVLKD